MRTYTHKTTGWTRTALGHGRYQITPTDNSGERIVRFLSAHSWQNDPADDRAKADQDRVVLLDGPALPDWAITWLDAAVRKSCQSGRDALRAACDQADHDSDLRDAWAY